MSFIPEKQDASNFNGGMEFADGDVLKAVVLNNLIKGLLYAQNTDGLPKVTEADNGKLLQVVDGKWELVDLLYDGSLEVD